MYHWGLPALYLWLVLLQESKEDKEHYKTPLTLHTDFLNCSHWEGASEPSRLGLTTLYLTLNWHKGSMDAHGQLSHSWFLQYLYILLEICFCTYHITLHCQRDNNCQQRIPCMCLHTWRIKLNLIDILIVSHSGNEMSPKTKTILFGFSQMAFCVFVNSEQHLLMIHAGNDVIIVWWQQTRIFISSIHTNAVDDPHKGRPSDIRHTPVYKPTVAK